MKFVFCSIGKEDSGLLKSAIEEFLKRIKYYFSIEWKVMAASKIQSGPINESKAKDATLILQYLKKDDYLVALDEAGTMLSSPQLATRIQTCANQSVKEMVFVIGGAYGLHESVLQRANFIWSLSPLTFPHQLVRLILAEQVYRACTIIKNEKYHHG